MARIRCGFTTVNWMVSFCLIKQISGSIRAFCYKQGSAYSKVRAKEGILKGNDPLSSLTALHNIQVNNNIIYLETTKKLYNCLLNGVKRQFNGNKAVYDPSRCTGCFPSVG